jgi:hypothetical protein
MRNKLLIIGAFLVVLIISIGFVSIKISYYNELDSYGLISRYALNFLLVAVAPALALTIILSRQKSHKIDIAIVLIPVFLLIFIKLVFPDVAEASYVTNFSDSPGQLVRGLYVTATGHSNINVDGYFDMQPGFFWTTSIILNVANGVPSSLISPISEFIMKRLLEGHFCCSLHWTQLTIITPHNHTVIYYTGFLSCLCSFSLLAETEN